jgi:hypothetical protein
MKIAKICMGSLLFLLFMEPEHFSGVVKYVP